MPENKPTLAIMIRSAILWSTMGLLAVPYTVIAIAIIILPIRIRHRVIRSWADIYVFIAKHLCGVNYTVMGLENFVAGPALIASNHQSMWETAGFAHIFPQHVWILKRELLHVPFFGWAISTLAPIAINRSKGSIAIQQILKQSTDRIKRKLWILVFPEGTRVKPGTRKPFKTGISKMSLALNLPVVPVAHNAGYILPRAGFWIYPGIVNIIVDKPIYPLPDETPEDLTLRIENVIANNLAKIIR